MKKRAETGYSYKNETFLKYIDFDSSYFSVTKFGKTFYRHEQLLRKGTINLAKKKKHQNKRFANMLSWKLSKQATNSLTWVIQTLSRRSLPCAWDLSTRI